MAASNHASDAATRRDRGAGFILVAVLAVMALLAGLIGAVSLLTRSAVGTASVMVDDILADGLLRAGVEIAAYELLVLGERPDEVDGQLIRLNEGSVTLFSRPTGGAVDINGSPPELLVAVYERAKLKGMKPDAFAARVIDWRDPDDETLSKGAEADAYAAAGVPFRPANTPFRTVDDLQWVLGVSAADVAKLKPFLTVHNVTGTINLFDADQATIEMIPGFKRPQVQRVLKLRAKRTEAVAAQLLSVVPEAAQFVNADLGPPPVTVVRVEARPNRGATRIVDAAMIRDPTGREAFRIVGWSEGGDALKGP